MAFVIDFQAFKSLDNKFIVKELAIVRVDGDSEFHTLFKPPQPYNTLSDAMKQRVDYLTTNIHGLNWNDGFVDFTSSIDSIIEFLLTNANLIFVKGLERIKFINKILNYSKPILNLDDYMVRYIGYNKHLCSYHSIDTGRCSLNKAKEFKQWLIFHGYS